MRPVTLLVLADEEGGFDPHASEAALRRAMPGVAIAQIVPIEEPAVGAWLRSRRARRCRTRADVLRTPERLQPVVLDADLPPSAW
ncbi:hypothetical protein [Botrimarina sp.]|uniref:hypothetical protein n=1 Tax=Botrimarina sp. TaxID=2795802 RepID=UPI0032EF3437